MEISSPLSIIDEIFDRCKDPSKDSFGEREYYEKLLCDESFVNRIPYLTAAAIGSIPHNSLVRYRGLVQDVYNMEYFVGVYERQGRLALSKYRDVLEGSPSGSGWLPDTGAAGVDLSGPGARIMERHSLLCVPIPGESAWVQEYTSTSTSGQKQAGGMLSKPGRSVSTDIPTDQRKKRAADDIASIEESGEMVIAVDAEDPGAIPVSGQNSGSHHAVDDTSAPLLPPKSKSQRCVTFAEHEDGPAGRGDAQVGLPVHAPDDPSFYSVEKHAGCACVAKVYDCPDQVFLLNDMVEMVGVYSTDSPIVGAGGDFDVDAEDEFGDAGMGDEVPWPASKVPRLHCLVVRKVDAVFPCFYASDIASPSGTLADTLMGEENASEVISPVAQPCMRSLRQGIGAFGARDEQSIGLEGLPPLDFAFARTQVLAALRGALHGDAVAAEYVLLGAISRVLRRDQGLLLGCLPVCLGGVAEQDHCLEQLQRALQLFVPRCTAVDLSVVALNQHDFQPSKDYAKNYMLPSPLQLGAGTALLLDVRRMSNGVLGDRGVRSANALTSVVCKQELPVQFAYCDVRVATDYPVVVLSSTNGCAFDGREAVVVPLQSVQAMDGPSDEPRDPAVLASMRQWWARARQHEASVVSELVTTAEQDFVFSRQQNSRLTPEDFSKWLTLARLVAVSFGSADVTPQHWAHMKALESARLARFSTI